MTENSKESSKSQQKKNVFEKIKENMDDKDEQLAFISVVVRLVVVAWTAESVGIEPTPDVIVIAPIELVDDPPSGV